MEFSRFGRTAGPRRDRHGEGLTQDHPRHMWRAAGPKSLPGVRCYAESAIRTKGRVGTIADTADAA